MTSPTAVNIKTKMNGKPHDRNFWFKALVLLGLVLVVALLVQTIGTYYYVSRYLIQQQAKHELDQRIMGFERTLRAVGTSDTVYHSKIADELRREASDQIAWLRILDIKARGLAKSGTSTDTVYSPGRMREAFEKHEKLAKVLATPSGKVLATVRPFRARAPSAMPSAVERRCFSMLPSCKT